MTRRAFLSVSIALPLLGKNSASVDVAAIDRERILKAAAKYLNEKPVTITASRSPRSAGGLHDYFSEGDYWWPDLKKPDGPYVRRDGMSNPNNFDDHRKALLRLSVQAPALCAAWVLTHDKRYADHAAAHLRAWFIDPNTLMNPNLQYAQAIHGRVTGRGTGIIDTIHLVEVARGAQILHSSGALAPAEFAILRQWFADYLTWMAASKNGKEERDAKNNHGTCWVMQAAEFARFAGNYSMSAYCSERFKNVLVPDQIAKNGSFPLELHRTKPYSYSLFNLEAMSAVCQVLSTSADNLWTFETKDGRGIANALAFLYPYIKDKSKWPYPPDVMYFDWWPVRESSLLFGGLALKHPEYIALWKTLNPDPAVEEVIRNFPIRQPVLWV